VTVVGPRIYNLFPSLVGSVHAWTEHLPRIAGMEFDWIFLNPIHYPGFSGSLYAVKNPYRLHDRFQGGASESADDLLRGFLKQARKRGLRVMLDLVVNHTAKDALLAEQHPEWYRRDSDGSLYSPRAVDPDDHSKVTVWGDLAELDYENPEARAGLIPYWQHYVRHYVGLGVKGFRCDAAYQVPSEVWQALIAAAHEVDPEVQFFAETLGCTTEQVVALSDAGFSYIFNSSKWWDFKAPWLLEQYETFRRIAPSVAFPESHDTDRLATEVGSQDTTRLAAQLKMRYLFSACFSSGVMVPIGYEYGFTRKLDVVHTTPQDWEEPKVDISQFIADVNAMKAGVPALNVEGPQFLITAPHNPVVGLCRQANGAPGDGTSGNGVSDCVVLLINPDENRPHSIDPGPLLGATGGTFDGFRDITPQSAPQSFKPGETITLEPLEMRIFRGNPEAAAVFTRGVESEIAREASQARLQHLAGERIAIEGLYPEIDGGRFAVKREVGDVLEVWADLFGDGHDKINACVQYKVQGETEWHEAPMVFHENDRWFARVPLTVNGRYLYTVEAWRDLFEHWRADMVKRLAAGQKPALELTEGRHLVERSAEQAQGIDREVMENYLRRIAKAGNDDDQIVRLIMSDDLHLAMRRSGERVNPTRYRTELECWVDRTKARFAAWYELFPRSTSDDPNRHGTFDDVIAKMPYVRDMGFDVLYFTPIHPIGKTARKGKNNSLTAEEGDVGSPYAIGSEEGGHKAIHPELGTVEDFRRMVAAAHEHGLEIALDFAIQASRDHPWIKEHPEWFDWRPDGSIRFAENPPKKYEDIVNVHFYRGALPDIWYELRDTVLYWADLGVKIFRVDNPHTKPFPFWEWMIRDVLDRYPDAIFLAEAFTRPKVMKRLAKLGFTQSYSYFTWRNHKQELTDYLVELTMEEPKEYMRANFFANTPDILPPILQTGGRPAFMMRAVLASTLSSVYGLYSGYELCEGRPVPGKEEYLNSEKYELKAWDWDRPGNIRAYITRLNRIRRENPALHEYENLRFYGAFDDNILYYGKMTATKDNFILIAVNLDPHAAHGATIEVPLWELGLPDSAHVEVEDLFTGGRFFWYGKFQQIWLDPQQNPAAIWRIVPPGSGARP
jgi:starch synthase (maltosyl-transferring)